MERESKTLDYLENISRSYLKTDSAYANYGTGEIQFDISDDRKRIGIANPEQAILHIENQNNDNIHPHPDFIFEIAGDNVITLAVKKGQDMPYCYQNKAYKRNDSSTIEVTPMEYKNLTLRSLNITFTEIPANNQNLTFDSFSARFLERFGIPVSNPDTWITLGLSTVEGGFTNAAEILSDQNSFPGIDLIVYGESQMMIRKRETLANMSVLDQIEKCVSLFIEQYTYETPSALYREVKELIPVESFREVITNAVVHREWQVHSAIKVEFFPDKAMITSPGGLPEGMNAEEYLSDRHLSILRNQSLALVFLRLGLIESLGSGIPKIMESYASSLVKPDFRISENMIGISLPVMTQLPELTEEQWQVYQIIKNKGSVSPKEIRNETEVSKSTVQRILNYLVKIDAVSKTGKGPGVRYRAQ